MNGYEKDEKEPGGSGVSGVEEQEADAWTEERYSSEGSGETLERRKREGFVYFAKTTDNRFLKIGHSINLDVRLKQLRSSAKKLGSDDVELIGFIPGSCATERWFQMRFEDFRFEPEWFIYTEEVKIVLALIRLLPPGHTAYCSLSSSWRRTVKQVKSDPRLWDGLNRGCREI